MIERFIVNISSTEQVFSSYSGIFGLAKVNMMTEIVCKPEFIEQCKTYNFIGTTITNLPTTGMILDLVVPPTILVIVLIAVIALLSIVTILYWKIKRNKKANTSKVVRYMRRRDGDACEIQTVYFDNSSTINSTTPVDTVSLMGRSPSEEKNA